MHTEICISRQYLDNVINNGTSDYANAYFEINYVKVFSLGQPIDPSSSGSSSTIAATSSASTATASGASASDTGGSSDASTSRVSFAFVGAAAALSWLCRSLYDC